MECNICNYKHSSTQTFFSHMVTHRHEANSSFKCGVPTCHKTFKTFYAFDIHISRYHNSIRRTNKGKSLYTNLQCNNVLCKKKFAITKDLVSHLINSHMKAGQTIQCCFTGCNRSYSLKNSFTSHVSRKHSVVCHKMLEKDSNIGNLVQQANPKEISNDNHTVNTCEQSSFTKKESLVNAEAETKENIALFCLMLEAKLLIPSSSVQKIVQEISFLISKENNTLNSVLENKVHSLGLNEDQLKEIMSCVKKNNLTTILNSENGELRSTFLRKSYFEENFNLVKPVEMTLGKDKFNEKQNYHYIPIKETLTSILKDKTFNFQLENPLPSQIGILTDLKDGNLFHSVTQFQNQIALRLVLYQDSFEIVNPLGSARNKHKILAFYFTINEIYPAYRCSVPQMQLLLLCKEKYIKIFGERRIFRRLVDDLKELENGVNINGTNIKAAVLCICGDNLGSHFIGGFSQNFSTSDNMCRFCTMKRTQWKSQAYPVLNAAKFTRESYNAEIESAGSEASIFNELKFFHVCYGLPPCIAHDLFEGIVVTDLALYLRHFVITKKYFTLDEINMNMSNIKFIDNDAICKPAVISKNGYKLIGTASQNWAFLRFLPLGIANRIDTSDSVWELILKLREITEFAVAPKLSHGQVMYMKTVIEEYLEDRKILFPNDNFKPKHHFVHHYPELILHFGPLIRVWTLRFESKHSFFKNVARRSQNYKNVTHTLSLKHQLLQAYNLHGSLFPKKVHISDRVQFNINLYNDTIRNAVKKIIKYNSFFSQNSVEVYGTRYKIGQFLYLDEFMFGEIILILSNNADEVFFVQKVWESSWCFERGIYILSEAAYECLKCIEYSDLSDNYPLSKYVINSENIIVLKHKPGVVF